MYEKIALSLPIDHFPKHNVKGFSIPINIKKMLLMKESVFSLKIETI